MSVLAPANMKPDASGEAIAARSLASLSMAMHRWRGSQIMLRSASDERAAESLESSSRATIKKMSRTL